MEELSNLFSTDTLQLLFTLSQSLITEEELHKIEVEYAEKNQSSHVIKRSLLFLILSSTNTTYYNELLMLLDSPLQHSLKKFRQYFILKNDFRFIVNEEEDMLAIQSLDYIYGGDVWIWLSDAFLGEQEFVGMNLYAYNSCEISDAIINIALEVWENAN